MKSKLLKGIVAGAIATLLGACGGGGASSPASQPTLPLNTAPVANAGQAQTVVIGSSVTLNGTGSNDAEKDPLTYLWTLTSKPLGSSASLPSSTSSQPSFTPDVLGDYVATLVVNDGKLNSVASNVTITAKAVSFSSLPPATAPVEGTLTDWLITKSTSPLTGTTTTFLNASSLEGDFILTCTGDGNFSYFFRTASVTANGAVQMRVGTNPIISETWLESSSGGYRLLVPAKSSTDLLQKLYKNWDFVFQYNGYSTGVHTAENGSAGLSSAIDKTRADCKWPTDLFPPQNGWGKALPTTPPDDAIEATDLSGLDITKRVRLIAWKALNASGKPQLLVRVGDAANNNVAMGISDNRLYVTQDGKMVSAVSGFSFNNSASKPLIFALNGDYDASRPLTLTMMAYHSHTTDKLTPIAEVKFSQ